MNCARPCRGTWRGSRGRRGRRWHLFAIAAPHVSPEGGWQSYRAAYSKLKPEHRDRTFVILATSHWGEPGRFGLTRKRFRTPLGEARTDQPLTDWLARAGGGAVEMEDYCHSFEHTVELQLISAARDGAGCADSADLVRVLRAQRFRKRAARG